MPRMELPSDGDDIKKAGGQPGSEENRSRKNNNKNLEQLKPLDVARKLVASGVSVIPVRTDGTKAPAVSWKTFQERLPTDDELLDWFGSAEPCGIAMICGEVSGGLEVLDFEDQASFEEWRDSIRGLPFERTLPVVKTPGGGAHVLFKSDACGPGEKLAKTADATRGHDGLLAESRGERQYAVTVGSPASCHPSGNTWSHHEGPQVWDVPQITRDLRDILLALARALDDNPRPEPSKESQAIGASGELRPGEHFDRAGPPWREIFQPAGWQLAREQGGVEYWRRPGNPSSPHSAVSGVCSGPNGEPLVTIFTTAANVPPGNYGKFRLRAHLEFDGDLKACARKLVAEGYGTGRPRSPGPRKALAEVKVDEILIEIIDTPRRTPQKLAVGVRVRVGRQEIKGMILTSTSHGKKQACDEILSMMKVPDGKLEAREMRLRVMGAVREALNRAQEVLEEMPEPPSTFDILKRACLRYRLSFKYRHRIWAEFGEGRFIGSRDLEEMIVRPQILKELLRARDLPEPNPSAALSLANRMLQVVWSDLFDHAPLEQEASDLGPNSRAARRWRDRIADAWLRPATWIKGSDGQASRCSLAARGIAQPLGQTWRRAHLGVPAWIREKQGRVELAMRVEMLDPRELDALTDHKTWARTMERYGLVGEVSRVEGLRTKVRIISADLARHILDVARDEPLPGHDLEPEGEG